MKTDLALYGGTPITTKPINYSETQITREDKRAVMDALDSGWLAGGGTAVREFEDAICEYTGYNYAIAVNSATSGLFLAHLYLTDSLVHIPALTFVATMNAPLLAGKHVRIVDVDERTWCMKNPSEYHYVATCPVSYAGLQTNVESDISDDAHLLYRNMAKNSKSKISVISTHAIKPIATGEGGVVLTNDWIAANEMRGMSNHGNGGGTAYGHNFRMSAIQAALGMSQLKRADENFEKRDTIAYIYKDYLKETLYHKGRVSTQLNLYPYRHSNHIFPIILDNSVDRNEFRSALKAEGVMTQVHYKPLNLIAQEHPLKNKIVVEGEYPNATRMWEHGFSLPMHNNMTSDDAHLVMRAFNKVTEGLQGI